MNIFVLVTLCSTSFCAADVLDGQLLSDRLKEIRDVIGVEHMQNVYNNLTFEPKTDDGGKLLIDIQQNIESSLAQLRKSLTSIIEVLNKPNGFTSDIGLPMCCKKNGSYELDPKFGHEVDFSTACVTRSSFAENGAKFPTMDIGNIMKTNYKQNRNILWQHYGTVDGTAVIYPSTYWTDCDNYDPRLRHSFTTTAFPKDKDVVIVLVSTQSMQKPSGVQDKTKLVVAKDAASTFIQTLNPNDRIAAAYFNSDVKSPSDCYKSSLSFATKSNINKLKTFVSLVPSSNDQTKNFEKALRKAFEYLGSAENTEEREQVILFISDGRSTEGMNPIEVIRDENMKLQNRVVIHTYLLGTGASDMDKTQLNDMAHQKLSDLSYGDIRTGQFLYLDSADHKTLGIKISTFYLHMRQGNQATTPTYTDPYVDPFSEIGLMTSMCLPVSIITGFNGVACTDVKLSELLKEVEYFEEGNSSYAFMIDKTGRTLIHPLLSDPTYVKDPVFVDISVLERSPNSKDLITAIKSGNSGSKNLPSTYFTIPRGNLLNDGCSIRTVNATFFWGPIANTTFIVCIVLGDELHAEISEKGAISNEDVRNAFMYHNRSLIHDSYQNCSFNSRLVTLERSSVKFTASAFVNPFQYLHKIETNVDVRAYQNYFTKKDGENPGFKDGVRADVWATYEAEKFWKKQQARHLAWRYIGTKSGIMRAYPGVSLKKSYDHEKRAWFRQTVAHPKTMFVTPPYEDALGSGILISLEHTIFKKHSEQVTAVIGTDIPLKYFSRFIEKIYPSCSRTEYRCLIIEDSGFIVMHPSFRKSTDKNKFNSSIHITEEEPGIAKAMAASGVFNAHECQDFSAYKERKSFRVTMPETKPGGLNFADTNDQFELRPIPETNIFILRQKTSTILESDCSCDKKLKPDKRECRQCDCLCYNNILYDVCMKKYNLEASLPCSAQVPDTSEISTPENLSRLPICFDPKCHLQQSYTDCFSNAQCEWCQFTDMGNELNPKCCRLREDCPLGKTQSTNKNTCLASSKTSTSSTLKIVGASVAAGIGTLLIVGVVYCVRRQKMSNKNYDSDPYIDPIPDREMEQYGYFENESYVSTRNDSVSTCSSPPPYPESCNHYITANVGYK